MESLSFVEPKTHPKILNLHVSLLELLRVPLEEPFINTRQAVLSTLLLGFEASQFTGLGVKVEGLGFGLIGF